MRRKVDRGPCVPRCQTCPSVSIDLLRLLLKYLFISSSDFSALTQLLSSIDGCAKRTSLNTSMCPSPDRVCHLQISSADRPLWLWHLWGQQEPPTHDSRWCLDFFCERAHCSLRCFSSHSRPGLSHNGAQILSLPSDIAPTDRNHSTSQTDTRSSGGPSTGTWRNMGLL